MKIIDWLHGLFRPPEAGVYQLDSYREQAEYSAAIDAYALFICINMAATLLSGCEFRTFRGGKEQHSAEWYALNVKPNRNQNAAEWKRELVSRLLLTGEVLCIQLPDYQRIIADSFTRDEYAVSPYRFTQVGRSGYTFPGEYYADNAIYIRSPVSAQAAWMQSVMGTYERLLRSAAKRFDNVDGERGILKVSAVERGKPDFDAKFKMLMEQYFKGYFANKNAVLPLFEGYEYTAQSGSKAGTYTNDLSAVKTLADEAISRAAQLFGIAPSYIRGDAAGIEDAQAATMTNCIKPLAALIGTELTADLYRKEDVMRGGYITVDTGSVLHHDLIRSAEGMDKLIACGYTINEVSRAVGQPQNPDPLCGQRFITRNYQTMESAIEGGEENA